MKLSTHLKIFINRFLPPLTGIIRNKEIILDNRKLDDIRLENCTLIYAGGDFHIKHATMVDTDYFIIGKAEAAFKFIKMLDANGSEPFLAKELPKTANYNLLNAPKETESPS